MRALTLLPIVIFIFAVLPLEVQAQDTVIGASESSQKPNGKRIRRQLSLINGLMHDEEIKVPVKDMVQRGAEGLIRIERMGTSDFFRITPLKAGNGIVTLHDRETGQIIVELRVDIRDQQAVERTLREIQLLLADIEGVEYKIINAPVQNGPAQPSILLDGYVLLPKDLIRIYQVIANYPGVRSLVSLSPIARQKIAEFITRDVNNPEVKISAVGNFIKLEGQVNNQGEKDRIKQIVALYLPDIVTEKAPPAFPDTLTITGRKAGTSVDDLIIDLITIRPAEEKIEPPPKMIQVVTHFVRFSDSYAKQFNFIFAPAISTQAGTSGQANAGQSGSSFDSTINLLQNLLPKLRWARFHGFAKVLDTASVLIQDKTQGFIQREVQLILPTVSPSGSTGSSTLPSAGVQLSVKPTIKSERSGLVELGGLNVQVRVANGRAETSTTLVNTTISVRDRQSAAFGGIIKKSTETVYGAPASEQAIITFEAKKEYGRENAQFVVFVTPIIKASASTGVEQVKKKFRLRD